MLQGKIEKVSSNTHNVTLGGAVKPTKATIIHSDLGSLVLMYISEFINDTVDDSSPIIIDTPLPVELRPSQTRIVSAHAGCKKGRVDAFVTITPEGIISISPAEGKFCSSCIGCPLQGISYMK